MSKVSMVGSFSCQDGRADEMQSFGPLLAEPPTLSMIHPISAVGFDI